MNREEMTIHKALAELKIIDDRISKAISDGKFLGVTKHGMNRIGATDVEEFKQQAKADYQRALDLIARRNAIKRAVVLSNATTKVTIAGQEYTVAEAIDMKNHGLDGKRALMESLTHQWNSAYGNAEAANRNLDARADEYVRAMFGATDMSKAAKDVINARADFIALQTADIVDPLNAVELVKVFDKEISDFMVEVDSALSVSNAITTITVEY